VQNRSAWLKRSVEGWQMLVKRGKFGTDGSLKKALDNFRYNSDTVYGYWLTCTKPLDTTEQLKSVPVTYHYQTYNAWVLESGSRPVNQRKFTARSRELSGEGLVPGLELRETDRWVCRGRKVTYGTTINVKGM